MNKILSALFLTSLIAGCSSNNNTSSPGPTIIPTIPPVVSVSLDKFSIQSIGSLLVANSGFKMRTSINNPDGSVNSSFAGEIKLQVFSDSSCSFPVIMNGSSSGISVVANSGIAVYSNLVINSAGSYYLKFSGNNLSQCGFPITVSNQIFPLNIKNLSFYVGTYGQVVLTFSQSATEDKPENFSIFLDKSSDSYISYPLDDSSMTSDDGTTRTYSFEFTDYNLSLQNASSAYLQIQSTSVDSSTSEFSDFTLGQVTAPKTTASLNGHDMTVEVKESQSDADQYSGINVYSKEQWDMIQSGGEGSTLFTFSDNQSNTGTIYFIGRYTDYGGVFSIGMQLHVTATTMSNKVVDLGDVTINQY